MLLHSHLSSLLETLNTEIAGHGHTHSRCITFVLGGLLLKTVGTMCSLYLGFFAIWLCSSSSYFLPFQV